MSRRGPRQAWRGTEHSGQGIRGEARRARAEEGSASGAWPAARAPPPPPPPPPARPGRPPAPQLASLRPGSATRAARQRLCRLRGRPRARSLAARRSQPQPPGAVLLRSGPQGSQRPLHCFPRTWRLGLRKSSAWPLCSWH
ncbi:unnamed protein product, partial [Rangifer tarandus platyrhynchus]